MKRLLVILMIAMPVILPAQTLVYLERADNLLFDQNILPDARIVIGNVVFRHDDALMYCDSANFYESSNSLEAFGHVKMVQGDTLTGYGDQLFYNGNTKIARLRQNVRLLHHEAVLTTDSLNYDRVQDIAYYFTGGKIVDDLNTLTSRWGQYTPYNKHATFRDTVHLVNDRFTMDTDTLLYDTESHVAELVSPTVILYEKETTILSSSGLYNTRTEESQLFNRSQVIHNDGKFLTGDTIYYDKKQSFGQLFGHIEVVDSTQQVTLRGNYGEMYEDGSPASLHPDWGSHGFATREALLEHWGDSLHTYMHADTLFTEELALSDTLPRDSTYQRVRAYHNVRIYRDDMQGVCDSAVYLGNDSIGKMYSNPVCWNDNNQVAADSIYVYFRNEEVDYAHGMGSAICIQQHDLLHYNQMSGKEIIAHVRDGDVYRIDVNGNAETVFFPVDEKDHTLSGCNRTQSSFVKVFMQKRKVDHVLFTTATTGTMYPMDQVTDAVMHLGAFFWAEDERPRVPADVLLNVPRTPRGEKKKVSASVDEDEQEEGNGNTTKPKINKPRK
ncbi:MAG: hypothetical protein IJT12_08150 [Paludibacteraceae bacterium]|nr:hypothetical protein [Paludibacteraceae bacterium]